MMAAARAARSRKGAVLQDVQPGAGGFEVRVLKALATLGARAIAVKRVFADGTQADVSFERDDADAVTDVNARLARFGVAILPDTVAGSQ